MTYWAAWFKNKVDAKCLNRASTVTSPERVDHENTVLDESTYLWRCRTATCHIGERSTQTRTCSYCRGALRGRCHGIRIMRRWRFPPSTSQSKPVGCDWLPPATRQIREE